MHKPMEHHMETPMMYPLHGQDHGYAPWSGMDPVIGHGMDGMQHHHQQHMDTGMQMNYHPHVQHPNPHPQLGSNGGLYNYAMNASQSTVVRPGTPTPHKRPGSWSRVISMESLRPSKKVSQQDMGMMQTPMGM
ncbi:hypothetical protein NQ176_g5766 [Zarea fungicola]|uniref:Uncharacterized protein n=1 Tax=Zarea fungicola TaxID=93591 RepID=A0ACC1N873_9HYPO|nr:hypothetical protein NQ176_g5766 [Lecanicillium fungicola]